MKKHIPNTITCCNLISGCMAIMFAFQGNYFMAVAMIVLGATFDFFDGMTARLLHVSSPIGKELDSLADVVTFGVAPSAILFSMFRELQYPDFLSSVQPYFPYVAFVMAAFSALRLAKFNLDERQTSSFIGVPTPANALFWGSLVLGQHDWLVSLPMGAVWVFVGMLVLSYLLIAELPLFALKFKNLSWKDNSIRFIFLLGCIPCFLLGYSCFAAIIAWYIVCNIAKKLF
ncbi:MAG: CDP-diacylglycerol--serine O-phosphatidyltransferase [Bacteroidaceae bacterium]|nr:CDP-diacylglycerol--serine O-phosphatidyltransferase [Bacteroidaceae bacterium]